MKSKTIGFVDLNSKEIRMKFTASFYNKKGLLYRDSMSKKQCRYFNKKDGSKMYEVILMEVKPNIATKAKK